MGQGARGEVEPQHLVALPVGDVGLAVRRQREPDGILQAVAVDDRVDRAGGSDREHRLGALVGHQQRAVGRDGHRPRVAQRRAAGQQRGGAAAREAQHAAGAAEPAALVGDRDVARGALRRRGRDPEARERDERGRETAPHAGTASERISAANASTTRGSKCSPAQRSISATASLTVRPGW